jgi:hypothetical protein
MKTRNGLTVFIIVMLLAGVLGLSSCNQNAPMPSAEITAQALNGSYILDGTTTAKFLVVGIERMYPTGAFYGRTNLNGRIVRSGGYWIDTAFHNQWQGGSMDGTYDATTGQITGTIKLGARTGTFQLQR